ncbi:hypothetical protein BGX29_002799, partial [Mortierella sp. GBA35]
PLPSATPTTLVPSEESPSPPSAISTTLAPSEESFTPAASALSSTLVPSDETSPMVPSATASILPSAESSPVPSTTPTTLAPSEESSPPVPSATPTTVIPFEDLLTSDPPVTSSTLAPSEESSPVPSATSSTLAPLEKLAVPSDQDSGATHNSCQTIPSANRNVIQSANLSSLALDINRKIKVGTDNLSFKFLLLGYSLNVVAAQYKLVINHDGEDVATVSTPNIPSTMDNGTLNIVIDPIKVTLPSSPGMTMAGLDNFASGLKDAKNGHNYVSDGILFVYSDFGYFNPSQLSIRLPDFKLLVVDSMGMKFKYSNVFGFDITPGDNKFTLDVFQKAIDAENFQQRVVTSGDVVVLQGNSAAVNIPALAQAIAPLKFNVTFPIIAKTGPQ